MTATQTAGVERLHSYGVKRLSAKLFVRQPEQVDPTAFIPIFHRWIQQGLFDRLLVDVADYRHVHHGPGVMLIAHGGQYCTDEGEGRLGLQYEQTRESGESLRDRLRHVCNTMLTACLELEKDENLQGTVRFRTDQLLFRMTDRLLAPNTDETFQMWRPTLDDLLGDLYRDATVSLERDTSSTILTIRTVASACPEIATLIERLSS